DHETVDSLWVRPVDALALHERGDLGMFIPTRSNLQFLAAHRSADEAVAAARHAGDDAPVTTVLPKVRVDPDGRVVQVLTPGDAGYDEAPDYAIVGDPDPNP